MTLASAVAYNAPQVVAALRRDLCEVGGDRVVGVELVPEVIAQWRQGAPSGSGVMAPMGRRVVVLVNGRPSSRQQPRRAERVSQGQPAARQRRFGITQPETRSTPICDEDWPSECGIPEGYLLRMTSIEPPRVL